MVKGKFVSLMSQIDVCTIKLIDGLSELKKTLRYLAVHHTVKSIKVRRIKLTV